MLYYKCEFKCKFPACSEEIYYKSESYEAISLAAKDEMALYRRDYTVYAYAEYIKNSTGEDIDIEEYSYKIDDEDFFKSEEWESFASSVEYRMTKLEKGEIPEVLFIEVK